MVDRPEIHCPQCESINIGEILHINCKIIEGELTQFSVFCICNTCGINYKATVKPEKYRVFLEKK